MKALTKVLALDDDSNFLAELKTALESEFDIRATSTVQDAMKAVSQYRPDVLLLDMNMPEISGLELLRVIRQRVPNMPVLMLTGDSRTEMIVSAIKAGAGDYILKGSEDFFTRIRIAIGQIQALNGMKRQNELLSAKVRETASRYEIVGNSPSTIRLRADLAKFKGTNAYVLILGENGTGKEMIARNLNLQEGDPSRPFVALNCGAIPPNLFESEFFGHVKGAFTGATHDKEGKFVAADGGDIFLDEIGDLPLDMQVKLLRVLEDKIVTPVGSNKTIPVNVRVIAATNKKLEQLIDEGKFREDLYYRINKISLKTTPLRERREDILTLAQSFASRSVPGISFTKAAIEALEIHPWPGNIRELQNTVERACIMVNGTGITKIDKEHLELASARGGASSTQIPGGLVPVHREDITRDRYQRCMDWMQKMFFEKGLELLRGNNGEMIERIGVSKSYWYDRKRELGIGTEIETRWM